MKRKEHLSNCAATLSFSPSLPISPALYSSYHNGLQFQSDGFLSLTLRRIGPHPSPSFHQPPNKQPASFDGFCLWDSYQEESLLWLGGLSLIFTKALIPLCGSVWHNRRIRFDMFQQGGALINLHPPEWEKDKINPLETFGFNHFVSCI